MTQTRLFIAYSRKDSDLLDELKKYLHPIVQKYNLTIWDDKEIDAGATWELEIKKNLNSADIFLFLITADSLASDYFHNKELSFAIERHKKGEVKIIPVIMRSCGWKYSKIAELQVLPTDGKPVISSHWTFKSEAFTDVVDGIEKILLLKKEQRENKLQEEKQKKIAVAKETERLQKEKEKQKIQAELEKLQKTEEAKKQEAELVDWEKTKADNKITVYQKFIKKYPKSEFNKTANNKIKLLRSKNKKAKQRNTEYEASNSTLNITPPSRFGWSGLDALKSAPKRKVETPIEKEGVLLDKGLVILQRSFYASLSVIGAALITMLGYNFPIPLVTNYVGTTLYIVTIIIGIVLILIYQLILMADDYSYITTNEETETKEIIWGIVLTFISFGVISTLGFFFIQMIIDLF